MESVSGLAPGLAGYRATPGRRRLRAARPPDRLFRGPTLLRHAWEHQAGVGSKAADRSGAAARAGQD